MTDLLQEFCDSRGLALRVDRALGVIRGIKILGLQSRNGREYLPEALARAVGLYEGAKVNVNHPKGHPLSPRDYQERIGVIRNVAHRAGEGLFGDFHFNPKHQLSEQLTWDAEHAPENVGFSHNVQARTARRGETTLVEEILRVQSVDLVADPATTRGLFEAAGAAGVAATQLEDAAKQPADELAATALEGRGADLLEQLCQEQAAEIARLRVEVDRFRAVEATHEREAAMRALLVEFQLPGPDCRDPAAKAIVSETFVRALLGAADEPAMRRLVEERAKLVGGVRLWNPETGSPWRGQRPTSRDQFAPQQTIEDARSFARAIAG